MGRRRGGRRERRRWQKARGLAATVATAGDAAAEVVAPPFQCQLAHGSPTGLVHGFDVPAELYAKIAACFDINPDEILYCTVNTHKLDMENIVSGSILLGSFIFAHIKGMKKEVVLKKSAVDLGVVLADNKAGKVYIKCFSKNAAVDEFGAVIKPGDVIEKINDEVMLGQPHFAVKMALRRLPIGHPFRLRLVEPLQSGFGMIGPRSSSSTRPTALLPGDGTQTLRFRAAGATIVQEPPTRLLLDRINGYVEDYLGIADDELALRLWELGDVLQSPAALAAAVAESELAAMGIPDELLFDMWGVIGDWHAGRIQPASTD